MLSELILATKIAATDLNSRLQSAVCSQDWTGAIAIVDQMRAIAPQAESSLVIYRSRLLSLRGAPMPPGSIAGCGTTAAQAAPANTAQATPANTLVLDQGGRGSMVIDLNSVFRGSDPDMRVANFQLENGGITLPGGMVAVNCRSNFISIRFADGSEAVSQPGTTTQMRTTLINGICSRNSPAR